MMDESINPWRRRSRRLVYENPWIRVFDDRVVRPDGEPGIYGVVHYRNRAVGVVAIDADHRVLLVGQYRYTLDQYSWEIPEGGAAEGEDVAAAARRELEEETGYTAGQLELLGQVHLSNSVSDEVGYYYVARELVPGPARPEPTEELKMQWVPFEQALQWAREGRITDSLSVIALFGWALRSRQT